MKEANHIILAQFIVLDFADRVLASGIDDLRRQYDELLELVVERTAGRVIIAPIPADPEGRLAFAGCYRSLRASSFRDTVFLWLKYDQPAVESFLTSACEFFCEALRRGLPLNGHVAFGDGSMDEEAQRFSGSPVQECNDAVRRERYLGVSIGSSANGHWIGSLRQVYPQPLIASEECGDSAPMKFLVDWPRMWRSNFDPSFGSAERFLDKWADKTWLGSAREFCIESANNPSWWEEADWSSIAIAGHTVSEPYS